MARFSHSTKKYARGGDAVNPYEVLHILPTASDEQVKAAYREMARRYHPDTQNTTSSTTQAENQARMQEINEAYDAIIRQRRESNHTGGAAHNNNSGHARYADIRRDRKSTRLNSSH